MLGTAQRRFPGQRKARQNGGYLRAGADQRLLRTVTRNPAGRRAERRLGISIGTVVFCSGADARLTVRRRSSGLLVGLLDASPLASGAAQPAHERRAAHPSLRVIADRPVPERLAGLERRRRRESLRDGLAGDGRARAGQREPGQACRDDCWPAMSPMMVLDPSNSRLLSSFRVHHIDVLTVRYWLVWAAAAADHVASVITAG